jgi:vacuolar-type H+-ATPase subunit H
MSRNFDSIDEALEIETDAKTVSREIIRQAKREVKKPLTTDILESDKTHTRNTVYELIQLGSDAAYEMLDIARETQKARDFEVVGQLLKAVGDLSDKLLDNQKKIKDIEAEVSSSSNVTNNTTNALFVGTTAELQKLLKQSSKETKK